MSENQTNRFPASCYHSHPLGVPEVPQSIYVSDPTQLPKPISGTEEIYFDFFTNIESKLAESSKHTLNPNFSKWISSLNQTEKVLEIHDQEWFINNSIRQGNYPDFPEYLISFNENIDLELVLDDSLYQNLPEALAEVYRFGRLWIKGGFSWSGYFYRPHQIKNALDEPWLSEYINNEHFINLGYPMDELKVFYVDSGCWLMYDKEENVYCGGVECGDFYRSSKNLNEVIGIIFSRLLAGDQQLSIESFAPRIES